MYEDYDAMREALQRIAKNIEKGGLPKAQSPMVFGVTGTGRVSQGILEVLEMLPHEKVEPDNLEKYIADHKDDKAAGKKIVISIFSAKDLVELKEPVEGQAFDKKHYYNEPNMYRGKFHKYLPFVSWLVNGIYWEPKFPRVLTNKDLKNAHQAGNNRLMGVCDISADYEGSIEFTSEFTSIEEPFLVWDCVNQEFKRKIADADANSVLFHSVDHLPAEMPKEASNHFGSQLCQFVKAIVDSDINKPFEEQSKDLPGEIYNAILTSHGSLTPNYKYIADLRKINEQLEAKKKAMEAVPQPKGLTRNMSLVTLSLRGHLFDSQCFNKTIDACEHNAL